MMTVRERQWDWRWTLVQDLIATGRRLPVAYGGDLYMRDAKMFWKAFQKCQNAPIPTIAIMNLETTYPDMLAAHALATDGTIERFFIEAMIMADADVATIKEKTGYSEKSIELFEAIFFDVRRHLDKPVFIMSTVLGDLFEQTSTAHHDHLWKAIAYFCGQETLEAMWDIGAGSPETSAKLANVLKKRLLSEAAVASFSRKPGASNSGFVIESYLGLEHMEIAKKTSEAEVVAMETGDDYLSTLQETVLESMKLTLKPHDSKTASVEPRLSGETGKVGDVFERPAAFEDVSVEEEN